MTVSTTDNVKTHTGDGVQTTFPFDCAIQRAADMHVYVDGSLQALSAYSVSINSSGVGGNVIFVAAPANGTEIVLHRVVEYTQGLDLTPEGNFPEVAIENAFDKIVMMAQQLEEKASRALSFALGTTGVSTELPTAEALKLLRWNSDGTALENTSGVGDVIGPASSTNNAIALFDGTDGALLKDGPAPTTAGLPLLAQGAGNAPVFTSLDLSGTGVTDTLPVNRGGTGIDAYSIGDVLYASDSTILQNLPGNTSTTKKFLTQTGNGSSSAAPAWDTIIAADVPSLDAAKITSGAFPIARGGTNNASLGVSALGVYAGDGSKVVQVTGSAGQSFRVNAGGTAIEAFTPGAGSGDVIGPAGATDRAVVLFNGTSGTTIKDGPALGTKWHALMSQGSGADPVMAHPIFGGNGHRTAPTSGTLTGEYWHDGDWTTTGTITAVRLRLHVRGAISIGHAIDVQTELSGGTAGSAQTGSSGGNGYGFGGGNTSNTSELGATGGGGGGFGGAGGHGGSSGSDRGGRGGGTYDILHHLVGSSGGSGKSNTTNVSGAGGAGGGGLYIESTGAITVGANITANGGAGAAAPATSTGGGGGGSGGGIDIRSLSTVTVSGGVTISAQGGAGGAGATSGAAGGGGGGGYVAIHGSTVTNNGSISVSGGSGGGGTSAVAPTGGASGTTLVESTVWGIRSAP